MKIFLLICAIAIGLLYNTAMAQTPPKPLSRAALETACLSEAQWPVTGSAAYANASAHRKTQMTNAYNADVRALKAMCVRLNRATPIDFSALGVECQSLIEITARKYGARADVHLSRTSAICKAMTTPAI